MNTTANDHKVDVLAAINLLSAALAAMERELALKQRELDECKRLRTVYLQQKVHELLPGFTTNVAKRLTWEVPGFYGQELVAAHFKRYRKWMGIIPRPGHEQALTLLQVQLAAHLDGQDYGQLRSMKRRINLLNSEHTDLMHKWGALADYVHMLEKAVHLKTKLPDSVVRHLNRVLNHGKAAKTRAAVLKRIENDPETPEPQDDIVMAYDADNDIPIAMRTLLFDALVSDSDLDIHRGMETAGSDTPCEPIATDDRLGCFS